MLFKQDHTYHLNQKNDHLGMVAANQQEQIVFNFTQCKIERQKEPLYLNKPLIYFNNFMGGWESKFSCPELLHDDRE